MRLDRQDKYTFAEVIAEALQQAADEKEITIKTVANWTGADARTVKNWFSGRYSPSAEHLIVLMRHCDPVLVSLMRMANRNSFLMGARIEQIERRLVAALHQLHELKSEGE